MRVNTKKKHGMGRRSAILMERRIRIAGAALAVAAGLVGAVAATASTQLPPSTRGVAPGATCFALTATIVGTSGNDALHGTPGPDVIAGRGGSDRVFGNRGNDVMCGGPGGDKLEGGKGGDDLFGGPGNDTLNGGLGTRDFCQGGKGNDSPEIPVSPPGSFQPVSGCEQHSVH